MKEVKRRFVLTATLSVFVLLLVVLGVVNIVNMSRVAEDADRITERLAEGRGIFGRQGEEFPGKTPGAAWPGEPQDPAPGGDGLVIVPQTGETPGGEIPGGVPGGGYFSGRERMGPMGPDSPETEQSVRYFSVRFDAGKNAEVIALRLSAVSEEEAVSWAKSLLTESRGWTRGTYRYRVAAQGTDTVVIVIDQGRELSPSFRILWISAAGLALATALSFLILSLAADRILRPLTEAERRQKQFVAEAEKAFKVPLTVVAAETELMEREGGSNAHTESIRRQTEKMSSLVRGIASLSVLGGDAEEAETDLSELLAEAAAEKRAAFEKKGMDLTAESGSGIVLKGGEEFFRGILEEVLENARKFGKTRAFVRLAKEGERVLLTAENDTDLPDGDAERAFDRFVRLENAGGTEGAGLGLAFVRSAVREKGGRVSAAVKDGVFRLTLAL